MSDSHRAKTSSSIRTANMSKGGRYAGGESSLDYLFGSGKQPTEPSVSPPVTKAPWHDDDHSSKKPPKIPLQKSDVSNNYPRSQGQNFITRRPTAKVESPPGGDSYLFDNNK